MRWLLRSVYTRNKFIVLCSRLISVCFILTNLASFSLATNESDAINAQLLTMERKFNAKISSIEAENSKLKGELVASKQKIEINSKNIQNLFWNKGGTIYTRWGRTDCPNNNGTQLVYKGIAEGGSYDEAGSGTNYLCLPHDPDQSPSHFPDELEANDYVAHVWGAEYQYSFGMVKLSDDVPCAVCLDTTTTTSLMIPAKSSCPSPSWKVQYKGFLCANMYGHPAASEYACVDYDAQYIEGKRENQDGKLFYPVVSKCGSLPCPPYENAKFMVCVVCSK